MEKEELTPQQALDLFTIQKVLNGLLDKYKEVIDTNTLNSEAINQLLDAYKDLSETTRTLINEVNGLKDIVTNKSFLEEQNEKYKKDNRKLIDDNKELKKQLDDLKRELSKAEIDKESNISGINEKVDKKSTDNKVEGRKEDKANEIIAKNAKEVFEKCKSQSKNYLLMSDIKSVTKKDDAFNQSIMNYLKDRGYVSKDFKMNLSKKFKD